MGTPVVQRNRTGTKGSRAGHENESRNSEALDANLRLIFDSLAQLLVANGYGFARLGKLIKISFVNAARSIDQEKGDRVSKARIAALTGLTRTEVSQLLRRGKQDSTLAIDPGNRTLRVVQGWLTDSRFVNPNRAPRRLQFKGGNSSFSHLVKKYSGDIPARAMLMEMKRLRIVRHDAQDGVHLVRTRLGVSRRTILAMRAISPWVEMLTTAYTANRLGEVTSKIKQVNLSFNSLPQLLAAVHELEHRRIAFVNGLEQMGDEPPANRKHSLKISIAVAAEKAILRSKYR
ncbi:MAG TPA: DUF6502 family protein [Steroidobacteraceae bacterium]|nr:DUF6502 family protein [Steroidobacteraceae bacterium]